MHKKKTYKLQRVLEIRERLRDDAARYLKECRDELSIKEKELLRQEEQLEECRAEQEEVDKQMLKESSGGIKSSELVKYREHLSGLRNREEYLRKAVKQQKHAIVQLEQKVEKAIGKLSEAETEVKVIEKHRENWDKKTARETQRLLQKENDEIGTVMHNTKNFE